MLWPLQPGFVFVNGGVTRAAVMTNQTLLTLIALIVTATWTILALVSVIIRDYTSLTIVSPVMLIVAGALFAARRNGGSNG